MVRRRRNKLVLWEWSPSGGDHSPDRHRRRERSVAREAVGAALLLATIIFLLSFIPNSGDGYYRRDRLGRFMCGLAGAAPGTPQCFAIAVIGWGTIVVTIGVLLKIGRTVLAAMGVRRDD